MTQSNLKGFQRIKQKVPSYCNNYPVDKFSSPATNYRDGKTLRITIIITIWKALGYTHIEIASAL